MHSLTDVRLGDSGIQHQFDDATSLWRRCAQVVEYCHQGNELAMRAVGWWLFSHHDSCTGRSDASCVAAFVWLHKSCLVICAQVAP